MPEIPKEVRDAVLGTYAAWRPYAAALADVDASFRGAGSGDALGVAPAACDVASDAPDSEES